MAEPLPAPPEISTPPVVHVARMSERLADLLGALGADDPTLASIERFLQTTAADTADARPAVGAQPLDRVAGALGLAPVEVDLVVLAGLVEEHEGFGAAFRRVNPLGEPYPTVGLAAQLLCVDRVERSRLRELIECGAATASGVIAVEGAGPFPERSLRVGERLWSALHGVDAWPAGVRRPAAAGAPDGLEEWLASAPAIRAATALERRAPVTVLVTADSERVAVGRALALAGTAAAALEAEAWTPALLRLACVHALARDCVPILVIPRPDGPP